MRPSAGAPPRAAFSAHEWRLIERLSTPARVQAYLNALPYNTEPRGETLRSFRGVVGAGTAHCFEAAMFAAVVLEQHGYPPTVLSFESIDGLDHVLFVYQQRGQWGSVARSRDPGLHGRLPRFRTARALALTYVDPYVDYTGGVTGYGVADLRHLGAFDWRFSRRFIWPAEQFLLDYPHHRIATDRARINRMRVRYRAFRKAHDDMKPVDYMGREHWTPIPEGFRAAEGLPFAGPVARTRDRTRGTRDEGRGTKERGTKERNNQ